MGQYYTPVVVKNGEVKPYNFRIQGKNNDEFFGVKLMEHSWWMNDFLAALTAKLYHSPMIVAWVGDYCDTDKNYEKLSERWAEYSNRALDEYQADFDPKNPNQYIENGFLTLEGKVLVNHTKKVYIDGSMYLKHFQEEDWIPHPLSLLTAIGNGSGGGDYFSKVSIEHVGTWALDTISVEDSAPDGYNLLDIYFYED